MLDSLSIRNVVLIDKLDLTFEEGLGVFTGETGAGKSILLDSLSLILGARADSGLVRHGENQLSVSASFSLIPNNIKEMLSEQEIDVEDDALIVRRIITKEGKSKSFINEQSVSVSFLKTIGESLVEINGQFSTHGLLNPSTHLSVLDSFGKLTPEVQKVKSLWHAYKQAHTKTIQKKEEYEKLVLQKEYLEQSLKDLKDVNPQDGEEETLTQQRTNLMNSEKILTLTDKAFHLLNNDETGVITQLAQVSRQIEKASSYNSDAFQEILNLIDQAQELISEASYSLEQKTDEWGDISDLPIIDERLFKLRSLARKHQVSIQELPQLIEKLSAELETIDTIDNALDLLEKEEKLAFETYQKQAEILSIKRKETADVLDNCIKQELPALKLEKAQFKTLLTQKDASETGIDDAVFTVSTNKGVPPAPLNKIASGGELSRFMLALKVNLAKESALPTLIFDEIDSGVGGATADAVGFRLNKLASDCQVLAVTHAPQVASYGSQHWTVSKSEKDGKITTTVSKLSQAERLTEIARMLSGSTITKTAEDMALELLNKK